MITGYVGGFAPALYLLGIEFEKPMNESMNLILWPLLVSGLGVSSFWLPYVRNFGDGCTYRGAE